MNLVNFIVWLSAGAVIGWFASWMVRAERSLRLHRPSNDKNNSKIQ